MRDESGKWVNLLVEASKEELQKADEAVKRATTNNNSSTPTKNNKTTQQQQQKQNDEKKDSDSQSMPSIHQKYAQRLSARGTGGGLVGGLSKSQSVILEEEGDDQLDDITKDDDNNGGIIHHMVKPSDTLQFICLKYKVSADALRGANGFLGRTLQYAPKKLIIPTTTINNDDGKVKESEEKQQYEQQNKSDDVSVKSTLDTFSQCERSCPPSVSTSDSSTISSSQLRKIDTIEKQEGGLSGPTLGTGKDSNNKDNEIKYHWVEPDDSLRWICLKYKISANDLRLANNFSGSNLKLTPKKLIIPKKSTRTKKSTRPPRGPRRKDSHGSSALSLSYASSLRRSNESYPGFNEDEVECDFNESFNKSFMTTDSHWDAFHGADHVSLDMVGGPPQSLSGRGGEGNGENMIGPNAPIPMVHLEGASKLYGQMSCASDSDTDGSDDEQESSLKRSDGSHTKKGVRYHDVKPTDTVEYLCLKYRVSASALRRANIGLTGRNLQTGPKRLIIPSGNESRGLSGFLDDAETKSMTYDDDTNTIACSEGQSTIISEMDSLYLPDDGDDNNAVYHDVQPYDTLQGICLHYGISAYELRRANKFRGMNLNSAPDRLIIPKAERKQRKEYKTMTEDEKIQALIARLPKSRQMKKPALTNEEARAYLEYNDWNFSQALRNAKVDADWKKGKR